MDLEKPESFSSITKIFSNFILLLLFNFQLIISLDHLLLLLPSPHLSYRNLATSRQYCFLSSAPYGPVVWSYRGVLNGSLKFFIRNIAIWTSSVIVSRRIEPVFKNFSPTTFVYILDYILPLFRIIIPLK